MPATMPALQYRHEAPPRLVAEAPHPVVHTGGGYHPRLASTFPAPRLRPKLCVLSFIAHQSINGSIHVETGKKKHIERKRPTMAIRLGFLIENFLGKLPSQIFYRDSYISLYFCWLSLTLSLGRMY